MIDPHPEHEMPFLDAAAKAGLQGRYAKAISRLLLLDYDGSLVPFAKQPAMAVPPQSLLNTLLSLSDHPHTDVYIISGRDSHILEKWFDHLPVGLVAEHGAMIRHKDGQWNSQVTDPLSGWMAQIEPVMQQAVTRCAQSFMEKKQFSLAWHYRNSDAEQGKLEADRLFIHLQDTARGLHLNVLSGHKVIEVRVNGIDKGIAANKVIHASSYDFILCVGDDKTDEDMFRQLAHVPGAFSIKVGSEASLARYHVPDAGSVQSLLGFLSQHR